MRYQLRYIRVALATFAAFSTRATLMQVPITLQIENEEHFKSPGQKTKKCCLQPAKLTAMMSTIGAISTPIDPK